jgi:hypothetical protein
LERGPASSTANKRWLYKTEKRGKAATPSPFSFGVLALGLKDWLKGLRALIDKAHININISLVLRALFCAV